MFGGLQGQVEQTGRDLAARDARREESERTSRTSVRMELEERLHRQQMAFSAELENLRNQLAQMNSDREVQHTQMIGLQAALSTRAKRGTRTS